jgi:cytochrome c553
MRILLTRCLAIAALIAANCFAVPASGDDSSSGATIYRSQCARCHGPEGEGTPDNFPTPLIGDHSIAQLATLIADTMPEDVEQKCPPEDAAKVADYIYRAFYSPEAQFRNMPARVELSRLTVAQYQNSVTDLVGSFRQTQESRSNRKLENGLRAHYFAARSFRPDAKKFERTDSQVQFDFGEGAPDAAQFEPNKFSIYWEGSVLAPDTGDYEFVVRTEHAVALYVNDKAIPLIDGWVKSGDETEYRAEIHLLGGRAYPIKLEFSKARQGVGDSQQPKDDTKSKASISLAWKRPLHTETIIPARSLSPRDVPEVFVLHAPFPPDDRSVGYERGTSVSKAWDDATTEAAIEVASYIAEHVNELAATTADDKDREVRLIAFCHTFAERALRRPLTEDQRLTYVDRQFAEARDLDAAVKRVVLLTLKSPHFLYREAGNRSADDPHDIAARLSFELWDSIPDEPLRRAADAGPAITRDAILSQLERMLPDPRTRAKLRSFFLNWLKVAQPPDISKDPKLYPIFTPDIVSDLRTSLELSLDELLASETADFRELLLSESIYLNGRLGSIYGAELPKDAAFEKVRFQPEHRSGLLAHPYLLACFAYTNTSSPIHRGVFISRNLLGRALKQPPEAVAPLPVDLHAGMTTRERVALQTRPDACQSCHSMINPLGFSLESFDAIGRFRETEKDKPVDAAGSYTTESGQVVEFIGAPELAAFLASSEETQTAFVRQLFHHLVKQPVAAYGPDQLDRLQQAFVANNFNIYDLATEIIATTAMPAASSGAKVDLPGEAATTSVSATSSSVTTAR